MEAIPGLGAEAMQKLERSPVLKTAELQGWLSKKQVHGATSRWQCRWCAFHQGTVFWFSGYYKIKGNLVLTPGTTLDAPFHVKQHTKPHQFSIATPEMQRGGVCLSLYAPDEKSYQRWIAAVRGALEELGEDKTGRAPPMKRLDEPDKTPRQLEEVINSPRAQPIGSERSSTKASSKSLFKK